MDYPIPPGCSPIPTHLLDLRPDAAIDHDLLHPPPVTSEKNIWMFWHSGYACLAPYAQRTVRAWHRRFSKQGWVIRVMDRAPESPLNIARYLDVADLELFPRAFRDAAIVGPYALQHTSDLVRWPLLLRYGGVYADVGLMPIGDLDGLWSATVADPASRFEVLTFNVGPPTERCLANYFLACRPGNAFFARCHRLLLALWAEEGGKESTEGMHASGLLKGAPLMGGTFVIEEEGQETIGTEEVSRMLTDYIIQGHVMTLVWGLVDEEDDWNGPEYIAQHVHAMYYMEGSQLINDFTAWNGREAFRLMSLARPREGEAENTDQGRAREIVEACLRRSFAFKLAHGIIIRVMGETLGSLWRKHEGSDDVPGTYAHWMRYAMVHWCQDKTLEPLEFPVLDTIKNGPLLREV